MGCAQKFIVLPTEKLVVCRWVNWSRDCVMIFVALADSL